MRAAEIMANEFYGAEDAFQLAYVRSLDFAYVRSLIDSGRVTKDKVKACYEELYDPEIVEEILARCSPGITD